MSDTNNNTTNTIQHDEGSSSSDEVMRKLLKPVPTGKEILDVLQSSYVHPSKKAILVSHENDNMNGAVADKEVNRENGFNNMNDNHTNTNDVYIELVSQLDSYDDCNYHVKINGTSFLLKIHNGVESKDFINCFEEANFDYYKVGSCCSVLHYGNALMHVLHNNQVQSNIVISPYRYNTPHERENSSDIENHRNNDSPISLHYLPVLSSEHSPFLLAVRLLTWVDGCPMSTLPLLPLEALADAGRFLGKIDAAFDTMSKEVVAEPAATIPESDKSGFIEIESSEKKNSYCMESTSCEQQQKIRDHLKDKSLLKAAGRYHLWDGKNLSDIRPFVKYIVDEKRRGLIISILDAFHEQIMKKIQEHHHDSCTNNKNENPFFRMGINHGDFNDANILMNKKMQVTGVIDFGDSVESWRVLDIAVAMAYALLTTYGKANRSISAAAAVLRGYNSVYPLLEKEKRNLFLLMMCRLACSCTLGAYSLHQNPENKYLLLHSAPAWNALESLWGYDQEYRAKMSKAVDLVFEQACSYQDKGETIISCTDLMLPDPSVPDLLYSVRVLPTMDYDAMAHIKKRRLDKEILKNGSRPVITFVTGNVKKLEEVKRLLGFTNSNSLSLPYELTNIKLDLPELQGDAPSIAREKCLLAAEKVRGAVIVEDTSLCFNALNGMPGVFIKWFLDACGHEGLNKMIAAYDDKTAYAQTVVAYCPGPGQEPEIFDGRTSGKIVMPRGKLDFGWDPIFEPDESQNGKTYAEMSKDEKDAISHRSRAFGKLQIFLENS